MFTPMAVWRLRHFADECRKAQSDAVDPLTKKELLHFETLFRALAIEAELNQQKTPGGAGRLRHFVDECRKARSEAVDPLTAKELLHFEMLFHALATDVAIEGTDR